MIPNASFARHVLPFLLFSVLPSVLPSFTPEALQRCSVAVTISCAYNAVSALQLE